MLNEASLIESELTLRKLRIDNTTTETRRAIARWLALALGLVNPGESRQSVVEVLDGLLYFQFVKQQDPDVETLKQYIATNWEPINEKTLRYHLLRMKRMGLIDNSQGKFYFKPPASGDRFNANIVFSSIFEQNLKEIVERIGKVVEEFRNKSKIMGE
ncbi:MAG: hypothetical protein ACP5GD_00130 [Candidatus Micrarchaeia archaeon]|jgi:hypothetical protein